MFVNGLFKQLKRTEGFTWIRCILKISENKVIKIYVDRTNVESTDFLAVKTDPDNLRL